MPLRPLSRMTARVHGVAEATFGARRFGLRAGSDAGLGTRYATTLVKRESATPLDSSEAQEDEATRARRLVAAIRTSSRAAENELVEIYRPRLLHAAVRLIREVDLAEDLANEALMIGLTHLREGKIGDPAKIGGYLFGIARNLARRHVRTAAREVVTADPEIQAVQPVELTPTPEDHIDAARQASELQAALGALQPQRYRDILVRYYVRQEEKAVICDAMELSSLHFNRVLWRARKALAKTLERRGMRALP